MIRMKILWNSENYLSVSKEKFVTAERFRGGRGAYISFPNTIMKQKQLDWAAEHRSLAKSQVTWQSNPQKKSIIVEGD